MPVRPPPGRSTALAAHRGGRPRIWRAAIEELLAGRRVGRNLHRQLAAVRRPDVQVSHNHPAPGQQAEAFQDLRDTGHALAEPDYPALITVSYIARFVEVRVEPRTRRVRVPRGVSIADRGRVVSPRTSVREVNGGVVWAIGSALRDATDVDPRLGGW